MLSFIVSHGIQCLQNHPVAFFLLVYRSFSGHREEAGLLLLLGEAGACLCPISKCLKVVSHMSVAHCGTGTNPRVCLCSLKQGKHMTVYTDLSPLSIFLPILEKNERIFWEVNGDRETPGC